MPGADLLRQFGLARNPFVDRTAEKTLLDGSVSVRWCPDHLLMKFIRPSAQGINMPMPILHLTCR